MTARLQSDLKSPGLCLCPSLKSNDVLLDERLITLHQHQTIKTSKRPVPLCHMHLSSIIETDLPFYLLGYGTFLTLPWKVQLCQFVSDGNKTVEKRDLFVKTVLQKSAHILFFSAVIIFASLFDCLFFLLHFFVRWMFVKMYICFLSYRTCFRNNKPFLYVFYMEKNL